MPAAAVAFVTSNLHKLAVARQHLAPHGVEVEHVPMHLDEIQATTVREVALHKARQAFALLGRPLFVEDSGFYIDELNFPGPFVKPVLEMMGVGRLAGLADLTTDRRCHFESVLAYVDASGDPLALEDVASRGTVAARVLAAPGPGSWSQVWDFYIPDGYDRPASALTPDENRLRLQRWAARSVYHQLGAALTGTGRPGA
jgi:non-canonical purine NTP pyrophosphatase (RdgB/HAM1 family)